jgi:hypothetical protein
VNFELAAKGRMNFLSILRTVWKADKFEKVVEDLQELKQKVEAEILAP